MMHGAMLPGPLDLPATREGSGTTWLPDFSPMHALHAMAGRWEFMLHGNVFIYGIAEGSERGDEDVGSINWFMGMARRRLLGGVLELRAMLSAEPVTVGECGYPDLLATGEFCDDLGLLHDRQHPHDLFMELAALYERELADDVAFELYGGPVGEPALGPTAYPHRPSALPDPFAPITHHWFDATHISFGVVTAGLYGRRWKLEGSLFNGREPDDDRFDLDLAPLDSYSGRLWVLPNERWALQLSAGHLEEAEIQEFGGAREDVDRLTASATYHRPVGRQGIWASTVAVGRNIEEGEGTGALLVETSVMPDSKNIVFGRGEVVGKTGDDLALDVAALEDEVFTVGKLAVGYVRQFGPFADLVPGLGASVALSFVGDALEAFYGERLAVGWSIFLSVHPAAMAMAEPTAPAPHGHPQH
ncbi:MAG TPA: hypothetical protein VF188_16500 [Longimicrobiales bacterium]